MESMKIMFVKLLYYPYHTFKAAEVDKLLMALHFNKNSLCYFNLAELYSIVKLTNKTELKKIKPIENT